VVAEPGWCGGGLIADRGLMKSFSPELGFIKKTEAAPA